MFERHAFTANLGAVRQTDCDRQHASARSSNLVVNSSFAKFAAIGSMLPLADNPGHASQSPLSAATAGRRNRRAYFGRLYRPKRDAGHISFASWGDGIVSHCVPKKPVIKWRRTPPNHTYVRGHAVAGPRDPLKTNEYAPLSAAVVGRGSNAPATASATATSRHWHGPICYEDEPGRDPQPSGSAKTKRLQSRTRNRP